MKLSELVAFKNELEKLSVLPAKTSADLDVAKVTHLVESFSYTSNQANNFLHARSAIQQKFVEFEQHLDNLKAAIKLEIENSERPLLAESYRLYEEEMVHEEPIYVFNRKADISDETKTLVKSRIQVYASWQHPGMIIRPNTEEFINDMVMLDPLYLLDTNYALLKPSIDQFNTHYQKRLRTYVIKEYANEFDGTPFLSQIPDHQFGFCFAYNFFNYKPFEVIKKYLLEVYAKLKPGGAFLLTFNDCDTDKGIILAESHYCCYTPRRLISDLAQAIGYEQTLIWNDGGPTTWIELKKPGNLISLRGGQTLAKIIPGKLAKSK